MESDVPAFPRTSRWLVALMMFANFTAAEPVIRIDPDPAWRHAEDLSELTEILNAWLDENSDFERPETPPTIERITSTMVPALREMQSRSPGRTRGLFDPDLWTIYLVQPWDRRDAHDASVLLHELVHARQVNRHYVCPGAQEEAAYRLQDAWLRERGLEARVNWIAVVLEAGCTRRDFHPD